MRDSCGTGGQVRHLKVKRNECGSPPAPRKASTWNGNQVLPKTTMGGKVLCLQASLRKKERLRQFQKAMKQSYLLFPQKRC
ncbi:hypothetical protein QUF49_17550 [Fictibacillus sp. b24]|uniref:hypothetical protein n=1 Tax=Fictibacillus sp. b24 TaxID=3055863 RepID=UPI0025A0CD5C|nr:hypothetical protein [Fictibacillus sp. b24]MDM5317820.1 hypothetical protein [Fictibacillus sp. b24]